MTRLTTTLLLLAAAFAPQLAYSQVAKIGNTEYTTVEEAFSNAGNGDTITMSSDASINAPITLEKKKIILDLQEYTINNNSTATNLITVRENSTLTITGNGAIVHNGDTDCNIIYLNKGTLNLSGGRISSSRVSDGVINMYGGTLNMTGGTIENTYPMQSDFKINGSLTGVALFISVNGSTLLQGGQIYSNTTAIFNNNSKSSTAKVIVNNTALHGFLYTTNPNAYTSVPPSSLVFTPNSTTSTNQIGDILQKPTCTNLILSDSNPFASPKSFTAKQSSYTRSMTSAWGTLCVPFVIDIENSNVECYSITGVGDNELTLSPYVVNIPGGTPVVIKKKDHANNQITIIGTPDCIVCPKAIEPTTSDAKMFGTFAGTSIRNTSEQNSYFIAENKFYSAGRDTTIPPFRSFFTLCNINPNSETWKPSPSFSINISDNEITGIHPVVDIDGEFLSSVTAIYNANGQRLPELQHGINIVKYSNGTTKKFFVK